MNCSLRHQGINATPAQCQEARAAAAGKCQACGVPGVKLFVDHDHGTGRLRGMICNACNSAEGFFKDDYSRLLRLHAYCVSSLEASRG